MRYKALIVCAILIHLLLSLSAQTRNDRFHGFGSNKSFQIKGYFGPLISLSNVEGAFAMDAGATAGFVINNQIFLGIYGQKLYTKIPRTDLAIVGYPTYSDGKIGMIQAGGVLGYIHRTNKALNWGLSGSAGIGRIDLLALPPTFQLDEKIYDDKVIVLIPKLFLEMNMTRWFKINVSAGYRYVGMINGTYINPAGDTIPTFVQSDYNKPDFSFSLLFGSFAFHSYMLK